MAPSRGLTTPLRALRATHIFHASTRFSSTFPSRLTSPSHKTQLYLSRSHDPFLNLTLEDHLRVKSPADSTVLFLYINRPCIVIGRNQNPWLEVNLGLLNAARRGTGKAGNRDVGIETEPPALGSVDLVRRRSGGGTVFHDEGNVNWSITCPSTAFSRDKHAEMVVRALRSLGVERARVNERHDIVLDQGSERKAVDPGDTHRTPFTVAEGEEGPRALKVSGSAYKLTRGRAMHHGTCLLQSPNLQVIPTYLRSPAKRFIKARGVESVSSPVANIGLEPEVFMDAVQEEFGKMYDAGVDVEILDEQHMELPEIQKGIEELKLPAWTYLQTPEFTFEASGFSAEEREAAPGLPPYASVYAKVKRGIVDETTISTSSNDSTTKEEAARINKLITGRELHLIDDWDKVIGNEEVGSWLTQVLPPFSGIST